MPWPAIASQLHSPFASKVTLAFGSCAPSSCGASCRTIIRDGGADLAVVSRLGSASQAAQPGVAQPVAAGALGCVDPALEIPCQGVLLD